MKKPFGDIKFISQVAAVSWAATAVPETKLASQILRNAPFCKAFGVEFGFMRDVLSTVQSIPNPFVALGAAAAGALQVTQKATPPWRRGFGLSACGRFP